MYDKRSYDFGVIITGSSVNTGALAGGIVCGTVLLILLIVVITVTVIVCGISRRKQNANVDDAASVGYVIIILHASDCGELILVQMG